MITAAFALTLFASQPAFASVAAPELVVAVAEIPAGEDITPTIEDAPGLVSTLVQAVKDKNWQLVVAMAIMLLVVLVNTILLRFGVLTDEMRKKALPWLSAATGCLVLTASTLLAGGSWLDAILAGLVTGSAAIGLWELVFKRLIKPLLEKKTAAPPQG